jgi:acyl carrier protein
MPQEKETIEETIKRIIIQQIGNEKILPDSKLKDDLGIDSLDAIEIIMYVEDEFGIEIPDEEAEHMITVGDIVAYVEGELKYP